jgi:hypothetical protein
VLLLLPTNNYEFCKQFFLLLHGDASTDAIPAKGHMNAHNMAGKHLFCSLPSAVLGLNKNERARALLLQDAGTSSLPLP